MIKWVVVCHRDRTWVETGVKWSWTLNYKNAGAQLDMKQTQWTGKEGPKQNREPLKRKISRRGRGQPPVFGGKKPTNERGKSPFGRKGWPDEGGERDGQGTDFVNRVRFWVWCRCGRRGRCEKRGRATGVRVMKRRRCVFLWSEKSTPRKGVSRW